MHRPSIEVLLEAEMPEAAEREAAQILGALERRGLPTDIARAIIEQASQEVDGDSPDYSIENLARLYGLLDANTHRHVA